MFKLREIFRSGIKQCGTVSLKLIFTNKTLTKKFYHNGHIHIPRADGNVEDGTQSLDATT